MATRNRLRVAVFLLNAASAHLVARAVVVRTVVVAALVIVAPSVVVGQVVFFGLAGRVRFFAPNPVASSPNPIFFLPQSLVIELIAAQLECGDWNLSDARSHLNRDKSLCQNGNGHVKRTASLARRMAGGAWEGNSEKAAVRAKFPNPILTSGGSRRGGDSEALLAATAAVAALAIIASEALLAASGEIASVCAKSDRVVAPQKLY